MDPSDNQARGLPAVRLRGLEASDCETIVSWVDSADALFQWSGPRHFSWPLETRHLIADLGSSDQDRLLFGAVEEPSEVLVGHAMLSVQHEHGFAVIGRVLVAPTRRGVGLGAALMREILRVGFEQLGLHRLQLAVYDFNAPAIACYQSLGFTIEGRHRDSTRGSDGYWTSYTMALLETEYGRHDDSFDGACPVRPARVADAPALAGLLGELGYPHNVAQARERLARWFGEPRGTVLVAERNRAVIGFTAAFAIPYIEREGSFARVVALAVDRSQRSRGTGRRLLAAVEAWAGEVGCSDVELTSSRERHDAHSFYEALGYEDLCDRSGRFKRPVAQR